MDKLLKQALLWDSAELTIEQVESTDFTELENFAVSEGRDLTLCEASELVVQASFKNFKESVKVLTPAQYEASEYAEYYPMECYSTVQYMRVYSDGLVIEHLTDGNYQLIISNEQYHGKDLAAYEKELHKFAISEGY